VTLTPEEERQLAINLFNHVWTLMELPERTSAQDDEMLHAAHASCYHWHQVGSAANDARGEWQCSRVYVVLGRTDGAVHHARRCLAICQAYPESLDEFDLPYAHEALARAHALAGDAVLSRRHLEQARSLGNAMGNPKEREHLLEDLATIGSSESGEHGG
jgi:hypothetical protein